MKGQTVNVIRGIEESDDEEMEVDTNTGQPNEIEQMEVSIIIMHSIIHDNVAYRNLQY